MRLKQHINETITPSKWEELRETLERSCKPYIRHLKGAKSLLCRGSKKSIPFYDKKSQRQDRIPALIDINLHGLMDDWTKKNWGFDARSASTFTTNREHNARMYGTPYRMFPIGDFDYAWNDNVTQLYSEYDSWNYSVDMEFNHVNDNSTSVQDDIDDFQAEDNVFKRNIIPHLQNYKTSNLSTMLKQPGDKRGYSECIVHCKQYYLIHPEWSETLLSWFSDRYWRQK